MERGCRREPSSGRAAPGAFGGGRGHLGGCHLPHRRRQGRQIAFRVCPATPALGLRRAPLRRMPMPGAHAMIARLSNGRLASSSAIHGAREYDPWPILIPRPVPPASTRRAASDPERKCSVNQESSVSKIRASESVRLVASIPFVTSARISNRRNRQSGPAPCAWTRAHPQPWSLSVSAYPLSSSRAAGFSHTAPRPPCRRTLARR